MNNRKVEYSMYEAQCALLDSINKSVAKNGSTAITLISPSDGKKFYGRMLGSIEDVTELLYKGMQQHNEFKMAVMLAATKATPGNENKSVFEMLKEILDL